MLDMEQVKGNKERVSLEVVSLNIDSIIIEENGNVEKIVYNKTGLHELKSCAKILVAMAIGIAIDRKMKVNGVQLSLDTKIYPIIKDVVKIYKKENFEKIKKWTIKTLLTHTTGYEKQMLSEKYIKDINKDNLLEYALNYEIRFEVDKRYAYNNVEPFIISVFFQEAFGINISDFINENIFLKLGIKNYKWLNHGKYCAGATGLYLKHEDFHKIGHLILKNGLYNEKQLISKEWLDEMCKLQIETPNYFKEERVLPKIGAGYFTFISRDGYVFRDGSNGQYMIINKKRNLLITILSSEKNMQYITEIFRGLL